MSMKDWILQRKLRRIWRNPPRIIARIDGQELTVSEPLRRQAAINLREDPAKLARIIEALGEAETRRRYPEAYL